MNRLRIFSPKGFRWILLALLVSAIVLYNFGVWTLLVLVPLTLFLLVFFYDPDRVLPSHPLGVMSPVDGTIESIDSFHDPFLDRASKRIRIRANLFRAYQARSPAEGKLMEYWPVLSEDKPGYEKRLVKGAWWIRTDENDDVIMVTWSHALLGRSYCEVQAGERIGQARRCGRLPMFSHVDLLVEQHAFIEVEEGQKVQSGVHTIAIFNHDVTLADEAVTTPRI